MVETEEKAGTREEKGETTSCERSKKRRIFYCTEEARQKHNNQEENGIRQIKKKNKRYSG